MEKELFINGKRYISSKRAAKLSGYTHDYIGQLSRAGKIPGKLVGRTKFVDEAALLEYKQESESMKKKLAQERSHTFRAGRKVPVVVSATSSVEVGSHEKRDKQGSDNDEPQAVEEVVQPETETYAPDTEHQGKEELHEQEETPAYSFEEEERYALPSPLSRTHIAAAVLFFVLAGSAFASPIVVPAAGNAFEDIKQESSEYITRVADGLYTLIEGSRDVFEVETQSTAASVLGNDTPKEPIAFFTDFKNALAERTERAFTDIPTITLWDNLEHKATERMKYAQFEIAYVGAVMEYRFLEIGLDVRMLMEETLDITRTVVTTVTSFVDTQLTNDDDLLATTGNRSVGIFERSAVWVFDSIESFKNALTSLLSADVEPFSAPDRNHAPEQKNPRENKSSLPEDIKRDSDSPATSLTRESKEMHSPKSNLAVKSAKYLVAIPEYTVTFFEIYIDGIDIFSRAVAKKELAYVNSVKQTTANIFAFDEVTQNTKDQIVGIGNVFAAAADTSIRNIVEQAALGLYMRTQEVKNTILSLLGGGGTQVALESGSEAGGSSSGSGADGSLSSGEESGDPATTTEEVVDETAPEVTLDGSTSIELTVGDSYADPGYSATDNTDGDITSEVVVGGDQVDTNTAGTYTATYNVSDSAGNAAAEKIRIITVVEPEPEPTPEQNESEEEDGTATTTDQS